MKYIELYKNIVPSQKEIAKALLSLGFVDKSDKQYLKFQHKKLDSILIIPKIKDSNQISHIHFAAAASQLAGQGIVTYKFDLAKMIEKLHLEQNSAVA